MTFYRGMTHSHLKEFPVRYISEYPSLLTFRIERKTNQLLTNVLQSNGNVVVLFLKEQVNEFNY